METRVAEIDLTRSRPDRERGILIKREFFKSSTRAQLGYRRCQPSLLMEITCFQLNEWLSRSSAVYSDSWFFGLALASLGQSLSEPPATKTDCNAYREWRRGIESCAHILSVLLYGAATLSSTIVDIPCGFSSSWNVNYRFCAVRSSVRFTLPKVKPWSTRDVMKLMEIFPFAQVESFDLHNSFVRRRGRPITRVELNP